MSRIRHHRMRWLRWLLFGALGLVVLAGLALVAVMYSESAFRATTRLAEPFVPGELRYGKLEGTLAGPVRITQLDYLVADTRIRAEMLSFDLSPWALLANRIQISELDARGLVITLPEGEQATADEEPMDPGKVLDGLSLPVHVRVQPVTVERATLEAADGQRIVHFEQLDFSLDWNAEHLSIGDLDAFGPAASARGSALVGLRDGERTDIDINVEWRHESMPLNGRIRAEGDSRQIALSATLREPAEMQLDATIENPLDNAQWRATLNVEQLFLDVIHESLPHEAWSGAFDLAGSREDTEVNGRARGDWSPADGIGIDIEGRVNARRFAFDAVHASVASFGMQLDASGELHFAEGLNYSASGTFDRFSWPEMEAFALRGGRFELQGDAAQLAATLDAGAGEANDGALSIDAALAFDDMQFDAAVEGRELILAMDETRLAIEELNARSNGKPENYAFELDSRLSVSELPQAAIAASGRGDAQHLVLDIESLQWLDGRARGEVNVAWNKGLRLRACADGKGFSLEQLDPDLNARVGARLTATADLAGPQPDISVSIESLAGDVANMPIEGSGNISLAQGRLSTSGLNLRAGGATLSLADAPARGFDFTLDAPSLENFHPDLAGALQAEGHFEGELATPTLALNASGSALRWQDWGVETLAVETRVNEGGRSNSSLHLQAGGVETPVTAAASVEIDGEGRLDDHAARVVLDGAGRDGNGQLELAFSGGWNESQWLGGIDALRFEHPQTGQWSLAGKQGERIVLAAEQFRMPGFCLEGPDGRACLETLQGDGENRKAAGRLESLPVGMFAAWLPPGLDYAGSISGQFDVVDDGNDMRGRVQLNLAPGGIRQAVEEDFETLLAWESGSATLDFNGQTANGDLEIALAGGGRVNGEGRVQLPREATPTVDAHLQAEMDNLSLIPSLVPELSRVRGRVNAMLRVTGPLDNPQVRGELGLRDASARILALGVDWHAIDATLVAEGREVSGHGSIASGEGSIAFELEVRDTGDGLAGKARINGENFKAMSTPEADIDISPRLDLRLVRRDLYIDGEVLVPRARIEPRDLGTATQVSEDQVIVNGEQDDSPEGLRVHVAVTTHLGDDVRIEGFGLKARLEGRLTVTQSPGSPPVGNGKLAVVEGEYKAYGQDLTLTRGDIIYNGQQLSNPGLDIRAERQPQPEITVGIAIRGPLSNPATSTYSDPPMADTEVLSYLLFGRSMAQATGEQEGQVNEAAIALGLGGQKLLGNVGRKLGVEEMRVEDVGDKDRASLVLGKYLSPDLYVSYGIGLFDAVNTFRIRYRISRRWTLEATSGLKSSADFIYTIER